MRRTSQVKTIIEFFAGLVTVLVIVLSAVLIALLASGAGG